MKKYVFGLLALALALPAIAPPQITSAAQVEVRRVSGPSFHSAFVSYDPTGCIITYAHVFGSEQTVRSRPGPPQAYAEAAVSYQVFNRCTNTNLRSGSGYTSSFDFEMDEHLSVATLAATIPVRDYDNNNNLTTYNVSVNLTWTGTHALQRTTGRPVTNCMLARSYAAHLSFHGTWRTAQVVGTVTDGTTNFTPGPSLGGGLGDYTHGSITVLIDPDAEEPDC